MADGSCTRDDGNKRMASAKAEIGDGGVGRGRRDTVAQRLTSSGRLVSFIATDLIPGLVETGVPRAAVHMALRAQGAQSQAMMPSFASACSVLITVGR
jgi:hypothetical protein